MRRRKQRPVSASSLAHAPPRHLYFVWVAPTVSAAAPSVHPLETTDMERALAETDRSGENGRRSAVVSVASAFSEADAPGPSGVSQVGWIGDDHGQHPREARGLVESGSCRLPVWPPDKNG